MKTNKAFDPDVDDSRERGSLDQQRPAISLMEDLRTTGGSGELERLSVPASACLFMHPERVPRRPEAVGAALDMLSFPHHNIIGPGFPLGLS